MKAIRQVSACALEIHISGNARFELSHVNTAAINADYPRLGPIDSCGECEELEWDIVCRGGDPWLAESEVMTFWTAVIAPDDLARLEQIR